MSKINYLLKSEILNSGLCDIARDVSKSVYIETFGNTYLRSKLSFNDFQVIDRYYELYFPEQWKEAQKINHASYSRTKKLKNYIQSIIKFPSLFLTLTFTDDVLKSTSSTTRRRYVNRFLNSLECKYVANVDFGKENGREHYHAVVRTARIDYSLWKYGAINGIKIRLNKSYSAECLALYVSKLTNHAIKETTRRSVIMYCRKKYKDYPDDLNLTICPKEVDEYYSKK